MLLSSIYPLGVYFQGMEGAALTRGRAGLPSSLLIVGRGCRRGPRLMPWRWSGRYQPRRCLNCGRPPVEAFEDVSELARWDALAVIGDVDERGGHLLSVDTNLDLPAGRGVSSTS